MEDVMKRKMLPVYSMMIAIFLAIILFPPLALEAAAAAKDYWCKYDSGYYELKYDNVSDITNNISDNPGSYSGKCELTVSDQSSEAQGTKLALCHYVSSGVWYQIYEEYTGYARAFWCEKNGSDYTTKIEKSWKIAEKIAAKPGSYTGICTGDTDVVVYCRYKDYKWDTKADTSSNVTSDLSTYSGSHRGGCVYHEWHMGSWGNDYWGHCTKTLGASDLDADGKPVSPYKSYMPDAPSARTTGEKKLGAGSGSGQQNKVRSKARVGSQ